MLLLGFALHVPVYQISQLAKPISTYKIVHATGNSQAGGESGGCFISPNELIAPIVSAAESPPTPTGTKIHKARRQILLKVDIFILPFIIPFL